MARKTNAIVFLVLLLAGGVTLLWRLADNAGPALRRGWTDGGVTAAVDVHVGRSMPRSTTLDGWLHGLLYAATGDTGPQVRQGCPGWLFLAEETAAVPHGEKNLQQRVLLAERLQAAFQLRGVTLVSVPVPDKVEQASAQLCGLAVSAQARSRRLAWRTGVDLHSGSPAPGYWRTDTHWNRVGAAWAAQRVAASVLSSLPRGSTEMHAQVAATPQRRVGDLAQLAGLAGNAPPFGPAAEYDRPVTLDVARSGGLLDDVAAPQVLLAGSSYSLNSGFAESLQLALHQEVSQQSQAGSGFAGSLIALLAHPGRLAGVRVVVWEWPLRVLYQPLTAAESGYLLQAQTGKTPQ